MIVSRRNLMRFLGGSAAGLAFTPVPWKLLDDTSIWTQNWSWIPELPRGELSTKYTNCSLCPAGCGIRARCVGGRPVSLAGVPRHPLSRGALCPAGLAGHHPAYHPKRLAGPCRRVATGGGPVWEPVSRDAAIAAVAKEIAEAKASGGKQFVAVVDERPRRVASLPFRRFAAKLGNGIYVAGVPGQGDTLQALCSMFQKPCGPFGLDLENTRTILSFGTPLLDGWSSPGLAADLLSARREPPDRRLRIIQVEPRQSRTASLADSWLPLKPGAEVALALALAHVVIREKLYDERAVRNALDFAAYSDAVAAFAPESLSGVTGIPTERIVEVARELAGGAPALVLGGCDPCSGPLGRDAETAIAGLNLLLGSVGRGGGIVTRRELPVPSGPEGAPVQDLAAIPDGSIRVLILADGDSGEWLPWPLLEKKLTPEGALTVNLAPFAGGYRSRADYTVPAPAHLESLQEVQGPPEAHVASFGLSAPLLDPPEGATQPAEFLRLLANALGMDMGDALSDPLPGAVSAIHSSRRGQVFRYEDGSFRPLSEIAKAEDLNNALMEGACWIDSEAPPAPLPRYALLGADSKGMIVAAQQRLHADPQFPLSLLPCGWKGVPASGQASPLMAKLYQESDLRPRPDQALVHPETGQAHGLADRSPAVVETRSGSRNVGIRFDEGVMPGVIEVAAGPAGILDICGPEGDCTWRTAGANVRNAS
jgi:anaerobic selenocysteine-containing dehydrogenase